MQSLTAEREEYGRAPNLKLPGERLMQQRFLQFAQRGQLALIEEFEALGFFLHFLNTWTTSGGQRHEASSQVEDFSRQRPIGCSR